MEDIDTKVFARDSRRPTPKRIRRCPPLLSLSLPILSMSASYTRMQAASSRLLSISDTAHPSLKSPPPRATQLLASEHATRHQLRSYWWVRQWLFLSCTRSCGYLFRSLNASHFAIEWPTEWPTEPRRCAISSSSTRKSAQAWTWYSLMGFCVGCIEPREWINLNIAPEFDDLQQKQIVAVINA